MVVDLDELNVGKLFEVEGQRARDIVKRPVGLAIPREVNVRNAVGKFEPAVTCKTVQYERETFVTLHVAGTFEEFV